MCFALSADSGPLLSNIFINLCYFQPLLQTCLNCQSVIIYKVFLIHSFLQSEGRTRITILEKQAKRDHEVTTATPCFLRLVILIATSMLQLIFQLTFVLSPLYLPPNPPHPSHPPQKIPPHREQQHPDTENDLPPDRLAIDFFSLPPDRHSLRDHGLPRRNAIRI